MKNLVYLNRITADYKSLYQKAQDYFHRHGIELQFDFKDYDYKPLGFRIVNLPQGERVFLTPTMADILPPDTYDFTTFCFNGQEFPPPNIPTGLTYRDNKPFMDVLLDARIPEANYLLIIHELMHALTKKANAQGFPTYDQMDNYFENNLPEAPESNFGRQWALLQPFIKSLTKPMYKHFTLTESTGGGHTFAELDPTFRLLLDKIRDDCGFPFIITSGKRSVAQNASLSDGVSDSAHLSGLAVDIAVTDSSKRFKLTQIALANGITRTGVGNGFVHIDISKTLPQNVEWVYY